MFVKNKAMVASRVGCSERGVMYFRKLLFKSDKKKLSLRRVESSARTIDIRCAAVPLAHANQPVLATFTV